ncbi:MAG: 4'-phosphopantetheinyl transferase family protein [Luteibaculum sp.]
MFEGVQEIPLNIQQQDLFDVRVFRFDSKLGLTTDELKWIAASDELEAETVYSPLRKLQRLHGTALVAAHFNHPGILARFSNGKPHLLSSGRFVSISHCGEIIAFASASQPLGIDVHHSSNKTFRVKHKFLNPNELSLCEEDPALYDLFWSAKEAIYKVFGSGLVFKHIQLEKPLKHKSYFAARIAGRAHQIKIYYHTFEDFYLCLAMLQH